MKISSAELVISAVRSSQYPSDNKSEFLLVGRSNVGKSSFINTLVNRKSLARTSAKPGKTQTLNFYFVNKQFYLVDAPGYGYAKVNKDLKENFGAIMENYLEERKNLKMVFMLVDFRHKPTSDDVLMYEYLKHYEIPVTIIATKTDKISKGNYERNKKVIINDLKMEKTDKIILFSAVSKLGKQEIYKEIEMIID